MLRKSPVLWGNETKITAVITIFLYKKTASKNKEAREREHAGFHIALSLPQPVVPQEHCPSDPLILIIM